MKPSACVLALAFFFAAPLAALADLHVNIYQTHEYSKYWQASVYSIKGCDKHSNAYVTCWGDGNVRVTQDGEHYYAKACHLSVWRSGGGAFSSVTWHADMAAKDNPSSICSWKWVNDNTIDLTIKN